MLGTYKDKIQVNLNNLELFEKPKLSKLKEQVYIADKMVKNKLRLAKSSLFDPEQLKQDLIELKTI